MKTILLFLALILVQSCQSYKEKKFDTKELYKQVKNERTITNIDKLTFKKAVEIMNKHNFKLKILAKEHDKYINLAKILSPNENPNFEIGLAKGLNLSPNENSTKPFFGLGFSIPLGSRLKRQDELAKIKEVNAYHQWVIEQRKLFLDLRKAYVDYYFTSLLNEQLDKSYQALKQYKQTVTKLIKIGSETNLVLLQANLQLNQFEIKKLDSLQNLAEKRAKLALLMGVDITYLSNLKLDLNLVEKLSFNLDSLRQKMLVNNFELTQEKLNFELKDAEVKLAIAEQYGNINVGFAAEGEVGDTSNILSFPISFDLPIFDRNQKEIKKAYLNRNLCEDTYKNTLHNNLNTLHQNFFLYQKNEQKLLILKEKLLPLLNENRTHLDKSLEAGSIDILDYLKFLIENEKYKIDYILERQNFWQQLFSLEEIISLPLIQL